jgi:hypothetical protein
MRKLVLFLLLFSSSLLINAQELNCLVSINSDKISGSNKQVYQTLQTSLTEFINQKKWTNKKFKPQERITCAFNITINKQTDSNRFNASIQVQAARPVYNTSYASPIINIKDTDFNFKYNEFEPFNYNENSFESNLISTIVFYINIILGVDADTFALNGGTGYFKQAKDVMLLAQQSRGSGWIDQTGKQNRYVLIDNLTSAKFSEYRKILYSYHREGMDVFSTDKAAAKNVISTALIKLESLHNKSIGNYLLRTFFDVKSDEIATIYSDGPKASNSSKMKEVLQRISPTNNEKWQRIK